MSEEYCNQCGNHCHKEFLQCNRGRRYFGLEPVAHSPAGEEERSGPLGAMMECGKLLRHGGLEGDLLAPLSGEEREELERLLDKLLADWRTRAPAGEHGHGHGHHR